jgi:hypothetical protein
MASGAVGERLADGRVVDEPTVVNGALLSAIRGPLHGAHMNRSAKTTRIARPAILGVLMLPSWALRWLFRTVSLQSFPEHQLFRIERFPHGCHEEEP